MNKVRKRRMVDVVTQIRETLNIGMRRTVSREMIYESADMVEELLEEVEKPDNTELITKLADDVWEVAKKLEGTEESQELKTISGCLHDIRANRDTAWYKKEKQSD